jgi:hypothetical protein
LTPYGSGFVAEEASKREESEADLIRLHAYNHPASSSDLLASLSDMFKATLTSREVWPPFSVPELAREERHHQSCDEGAVCENQKDAAQADRDRGLLEECTGVRTRTRRSGAVFLGAQSDDPD